MLYRYQNKVTNYEKWNKAEAFTLIELLVVISIISLLMGILMSVLTSVRSSAQTLVCKSNLHQLLLANIGYATENDGFYVPAASDMFDSPGLNRWHGLRDTIEDPFDPLRGPLSGYLKNGRVKECPTKVNFCKEPGWNTNFEKGCGGYGYNMTYLGSRLWQSGINNEQAWRDAYAHTTQITDIKVPGKTLMFADTAMVNADKYYIEYSFAEPPFTIQNGRVVTSFYMSPSIHFRHENKASIGWVDGHISECPIADLDDINAYGINSFDMKIGWFEPINNSMFDLE